MIVASQYHSDTNSPEFQAALEKAGAIFVRLGLTEAKSEDIPPNIPPSRVPAPVAATASEGDDWVSFEEWHAGVLMARSLPEQEAAERGLPSHWCFKDDGTAVVLGYADRRLHERSWIDVASPEFQETLAALGRAFVAEGLHKILEVKISA